jgi:ParB family chromosome partitioning protein
MQKARKGLGRGLSALIPEADMDFLSRVARGDNKTTEAKGKKATKTPKKAVAATTAASAPEPQKEEHSIAALAVHVPIESIEANPYQPRRTFSPQEMQELVDSIKEHGVLQPILVRPNPADESRYQLIAGERRWRASQAAGLKEVPAIIRQVSDQQALEVAIIENVQRHDISALDAAIAYRRLAQEFSLSQEAIAQRVGKSRVSIANTIRLLDLPQEAQKAIEEGAMTEGHGRAILLASTEGARRAVFRRVIRDGLSVRQTEELSRRILDEEEEDKPDNNNDDLPASARIAPEVRRIEETLQKQLGTRVRLRPRRRGGQVVIQYFSNEELDRLLKLLMK